MNARAEVIILGSGIAGSSLATEFADRRSIVLLEADDSPGRHATGRSAAMFFESYGNPVIRVLTRASRAFLSYPPPDFASISLLQPRATSSGSSDATPQEVCNGR
ncbi:MAG: FAD-dependent oxidoreductase [Mycobacteriales bacterium]